jgi:hypothetical protein
MVYGPEAVLLADIASWSPRVENFDKDRSDESWELEVNCYEERRLDSCVHTAKYLTVLCKYYNKNVKERFFVVGDLVLKWKMNQDGMHKLSSPWERLFEVTEVTWPTSYRLAYLDGTVLPNSWHIDKIRRFYPWSTEKERYVPLLYFDYFNKVSMFHSMWCLETTFYQCFITDQLIDHHSFSSSWSQPGLRLLPTRAQDPPLYAPSGRWALPGLTYVLLRANRLHASLSDHRSG